MPSRVGLTIALATILLNSTCRAQQAAQQFAASEGCPVDASLEPAGNMAPTDFVEIQSVSGCMDACPVYSVKIRADGEVIWNGVRGVQNEGAATRQVSAEAARSLIESYRAKGFWHVCHPAGGGEDGPEVITTVHIGDREKSSGTLDWKIYRAVGALAGTYSWIRGDPTVETVDSPMLRDTDFTPEPGLTDLMRAAAGGDVGGIQRELKAGAKVDARDSSGFTALTYASRTTDPQVLKLLLKAGADPNLRSNLGQTAIMAASTDRTDRSANVQILIAAGGDVNAQDHQGDSALMLALSPMTTMGRPRAVPGLIASLLKAGARRDLRDLMGLTALSRVEGGLFFAKSQYETVKTLNVNNGAARLADLDTEIEKLEQVRELLVEP